MNLLAIVLHSFALVPSMGLREWCLSSPTSRYRSGRSKTWLKSKCFTESDLVIIGTDRDRKTGALRALLANAEGHNLTYAGAAFIGLRGDAWDDLS